MPIKMANKMFDRNCGYKHFAKCVYDISEFRNIDIPPCETNDCGVLTPRVWVSFKNTKDQLFVINISRNPNGAYVFGYDIMHGPYGGGSGCFPSMKWKHNNPPARTLQKCLVNAMKYMMNSYIGVIKEDVRKAAERALRIVQRQQVYQMSIFDIL